MTKGDLGYNDGVHRSMDDRIQTCSADRVMRTFTIMNKRGLPR